MTVKEVGRMGGQATATKHGLEHFKAAGEASGRARAARHTTEEKSAFATRGWETRRRKQAEAKGEGE